MSEFMFATGIENSYPTIEWQGKTIRQDELAKTKHYQCWRDDFRLLQELGIQYLRYGPPYFSAHAGPGRVRLELSRTKRSVRCRSRRSLPSSIYAILACRTGLAIFKISDWPRLFADYAQAFARRFPWVRFYTPVNEIYHCGHLFRTVWMVERAAEERPRVRQRSQASLPGQCDGHARHIARTS